jgi:hypothetical protein
MNIVHRRLFLKLIFTGLQPEHFSQARGGLLFSHVGHLHTLRPSASADFTIVKWRQWYWRFRLMIVDGYDIGDNVD